jgi:hypothetical protein
MLLAGVVGQDLHRHARRVRLAGEEPVQLFGRVRQRAVLEAPRQQEDRLQLGHDRPFEAEHDVVEALVVVVVLDARTTHERDPPVDHHHLAMVEVSQVVEAPVDVAFAEQTVEVEEAALVGHDLDAALAKLLVQGARTEAGLAVRALHHQPDGDALPHLADQEVPEARADLAGLEAEDDDVHVGRGRFDVAQHPREERRAVDQQLPARGRRGREIDRQRTPFRPLPKNGLNERARGLWAHAGGCRIRARLAGGGCRVGRGPAAANRQDGGQRRADQEEQSDDHGARIAPVHRRLDASLSRRENREQ